MIDKILVKLKKIPNTYWHTLGYVLIAAIAYTVRGFKYIAKPQLFAEDGQEWLARGYNDGLPSLIRPLNGFLHTTERIFGFVVSLLPLQFAPFLFNFTALIIFTITMYYVFSVRTRILSNTYEKIFMVLCICLIANVDEFFFNFSNAIFLLGIVGILIFVADESKIRIINYIEKALYTLICFTLPFSIIYLPIVLTEKFRNRKKNTYFLVVTICGATAQLATYFLSHIPRSNVTIPSLISRYTLLEIYNQIIIPAIRFARLDYTLTTSSNRYTILAIIFIIGIFLAMGIYVMKHSNKQVQYLTLFLVLITLISLTSPLIGINFTAEETIKIMSTTFNGDRYFIFGIIVATLIFIKFSYHLISPKFRYIFIVVFIGLGVITSIQYHSFKANRDLKDLSAKYYTGISLLKTSESKTVTIPINPQYSDTGWYIILNRK